MRTLLQKISIYWNLIISLGLIISDNKWQKRRIRMLNGISAITVIFLIAYALMYKGIDHDIVFWESFLSAIVYACVLFFSYIRWHNFSCHFFTIFSIVFFTCLAYIHGRYIAAEYILVAASISSMLIFRNFRIIVFYFFLNITCFAFCKYSFTLAEPILYMPHAQSLYFGNHANMFIVLFLIVTYFKSENLRQEILLESQNESLEQEKIKSDNLLRNILPAETAEELKLTGKARSRKFDAVTILFSDFKNFTLASEKMSPEELVDEIHEYFSCFDAIVAAFGIEKIKTIGDAYMCVGGLPDVNQTHAFDVVSAALKMQEQVDRLKMEKQAAGKLFFDIRIGIHTGPVVAGIVGTTKFAYDIWGDTVNIASRMESSGEVGRVNISATTYALVNEQFVCEYRGKIAAKNKGEIDMFFVKHRLH